jgi:hypothetical protein
VAAKTRASLMVEGELPEEGLAALEGDDGDVYLALARRLADAGEGGDGRAHSLEALFAEARRREDGADELLVDDSWQDEALVSHAAIPFAVRSVPEGSAPPGGLPLFAGSPAPSPPAGAAPNGKIVTFEELAQLLPHRKLRPKPVPEGQLALFGS